MERLSTIRSAQNPALKRVRAVLAGKERDWIALEGTRLIDDALRAGLRFEDVLVSERRDDCAARWERAGLPVRIVAPDLLDRASSLSTSPGAIAIAARPAPRSVRALELGPDALVLIAAGVADPGNLGALARTVEASGASALVVLAGGASPWNAKALRGSMGSLLRVDLFEGDSADEAVRALAGAGARQVCAGTRDGKRFDAFDWSGAVALWVTSETGAMPDAASGFESVSVPMAGEVESLNVAVATSLLLYAAGRWRTGA